MVHLNLPLNAPAPRLCLVQKEYNSQEYGFNLHAERGKGQFVGAVDEGSPAEKSGLRSGDRIFAVNGDSIVESTHKEVVNKIKSNPLFCELLVINEEGALWYQEQGIPIDTSLPNIVRPIEPDNLPPLNLAKANPMTSLNGNTTVISTYKTELRNKTRTEESGYEPEATTSTNNFSSTYKEHSESNTTAQTPTITPRTDTAQRMPPRPRLCTLIKQKPTDEFGFNLHAERGKGHFIGAVDKNGIADMAGLETGQRIVGVNGQLVYPNTAHKEVVALIKRDPVATELLVASEDIDRWYLDNNRPYSYDCVIVHEVDRSNQKTSTHSSNNNLNGNKHSTTQMKTNGNSENRGPTKQISTTYTDSEAEELQKNRRTSSIENTVTAEIVVDENHTTQIHLSHSNVSLKSVDPNELNHPVSHSSQRNSIISGEQQKSENISILNHQRNSIISTKSNGQHHHGSPNDLLEQVFSIVKPPPVLTKDLYSDYPPNHPQQTTTVTVTDSPDRSPSIQNGHVNKGYENEETNVLPELSTNKHVIADSAPPNPNVIKSNFYDEVATQKVARPGITPIIEPLQPKIQQQSPISIDSHSLKSHGLNDFKDIFQLSAKEARQRIRHRKNDPRIQGNMSLEEKYNLIANL